MRTLRGPKRVGVYFRVLNLNVFYIVVSFIRTTTYIKCISQTLWWLHKSRLYTSDTNKYIHNNKIVKTVWIRWTPPVSRKKFHLPHRASQGRRGTNGDRVYYRCTVQCPENWRKTEVDAQTVSVMTHSFTALCWYIGFWYVSLLKFRGNFFFCQNVLSSPQTPELNSGTTGLICCSF
jgi:hypothetical protein